MASVLLSRLLENQVYGVTATDPATYVGLSLLLGAAVMAASCVPALRALRVDPITVLREEQATGLEGIDSRSDQRFEEPWQRFYVLFFRFRAGYARKMPAGRRRP